MIDIRNELIENKHYLCAPYPLLEYLCKLQLTTSQLVIYLLHWGAGQINGDWTSQLAVSFVASRASCSEATVKHAYNRLIELGLLRRTPAPKRMRGNRAVTVTEVLLPDHVHEHMRATPNRAGRVSVRSEEHPHHENQTAAANIATRKIEESQSCRIHQLGNAAFNEYGRLSQLPHVLDPVRVMKEILWSALHDSYREEVPYKAVNAGLKLVKDQVWRTPKGMPTQWRWEGRQFVVENEASDTARHHRSPPRLG